MTAADVAPPTDCKRSWRGARLLLIPTALAVGMAIAVTVATSGGPSAASTSVAARPAPAFRLAAVGGGPPVTLAGIGPRPVVLSFFASWCDGCRQEMATMAQVDRRAGGGVEVIGVDVNDSVRPARALLRTDHITYPVGADSHGRVASAYGLAGLPTTVFLSAGHRVVGESVGPLTSIEAQRWVDRLARGPSSAGGTS